MNISTDNYEAYLLDYMEGNLGPDETRQLQAFVAAQGLDWNELTEALPYLEAPEVTYKGKESLKKKGKVIPMLVTVGAAAAAAGLLFTLVWRPVEQLPKQELMAELKPITASRIDAEETTIVSPIQTSENTNSSPYISHGWDNMIPVATNKRQTTTTRESSPLLVEIQPIEMPTSVSSQALLAYESAPIMPLSDPMSDYASVELTENYEVDDPSLIGKGLLWLTNGRYDSFGSLISSGLSTAKKEISLAATDMALTAYYRADEHFEEAKERWQEKH